jgi:hypothetical protein
MEETRRKRSPKGLGPQTRNELIIARWERLGRPALGARELTGIQAHLQKQLGKEAVESPAAIARVLADEGAELRHPEVIECDALWRAEHIRNGTPQLAEIDSSVQGEALTMNQAEDLIKELEEKRTQFDAGDLQSLRSIAIEARETAQRHARRKSLDSIKRAEQHEIAEWLGVWIKTPSLFTDWLELRRRSAEFREKFRGGSSTDYADSKQEN